MDEFNFDEAEWELVEEQLPTAFGLVTFHYLRAKPQWGHNTYAMAVEFAHRCWVRIAVRDCMVREAYDYCYNAATPVISL